MLFVNHESHSYRLGIVLKLCLSVIIFWTFFWSKPLLASNPKGLKKLTFSSKGLGTVKILDVQVSLLLILNVFILYLNSFLFKLCILNTLKYFSFDLFVSGISQLPLPRGLTIKSQMFNILLKISNRN